MPITPLATEVCRIRFVTTEELTAREFANLVDPAFRFPVLNTGRLNGEVFVDLDTDRLRVDTIINFGDAFSRHTEEPRRQIDIVISSIKWLETKVPRPRVDQVDETAAELRMEVFFPDRFGFPETEEDNVDLWATLMESEPVEHIEINTRPGEATLVNFRRPIIFSELLDLHQELHELRIEPEEVILTCVPVEGE